MQENNKKVSEKYYIIISLILGLLVLGLVLYYLFQEYFTEEDIDLEVCRQSVILRNSMPNAERIATSSIEEIKGMFPLKCKTDVIKIDAHIAIDYEFLCFFEPIISIYIIEYVFIRDQIALDLTNFIE